MVDPSSDLGGRYFVGGSSNAAHIFDVINLWLVATTLGKEGIEADVATANAATACRRWRRRWSWRTTMGGLIDLLWLTARK